jgi:hypothetical protein
VRKLFAGAAAAGLLLGGFGVGAAVADAPANTCDSVYDGNTIYQLKQYEDCRFNRIEKQLTRIEAGHSPTSSPTSTATAPAGQTKTGFITAYGAPDNDPPNSTAIAYENVRPGTGAGGVGTYENPITVAVPEGTYAPGTRIYVPHVDRYFIVEDLCGTSHSAPQGCTSVLDLWVGGVGDSEADVIKCEESLTRTAPFEVDPPQGRLVVSGPLFNSATDTCFKPTP